MEPVYGPGRRPVERCEEPGDLLGRGELRPGGTAGQTLGKRLLLGPRVLDVLFHRAGGDVLLQKHPDVPPDKMGVADWPRDPLRGLA